jgi:transposase
VAKTTLSELEELRRLLASVTSERDALASQHQTLASTHAAVLSERDDIAAENQWLKLRVKQLAARLYGRKSERLTKEQRKQLVLELGGTEAQALAEDPVLPTPDRADEEPGDDDQSKSKKRSRARSMAVAADVERVVDATVQVPPEERACSHCGVEMEFFDYVEHERIEYVPAKVVVHVERREKRACKQQGCKGEAVTAERLSEPTSPLRVGASMLAELIESKCDDAMPVHRQCDRFARLGFTLPEPTAYGYFRYGTELLVPIAEALLGHILAESTWVGVDDTGLDVLDRHRKGGKYRGHLWCFRSDSGLLAYQFTESWRADEVAEWFSLLGDDAYAQVDDYKGYGSVVNGRIVVPPERRLGCMMHVRRRFFDALKLGDKRAAKPIEWIKALYGVEAAARERPPDERLALRVEHSLPVLDAFDAWVDEHEKPLGKTGKLAEAVRYAKQQRQYVRRCFSDGRFEIDNGAVERAIREPVIGRKNFLFTGSKAAGVRLAAAYTLVQSCRVLGIPTREYLIDVIRKLEAGWPARRLAELMPHRWAQLPA